MYQKVVKYFQQENIFIINYCTKIKNKLENPVKKIQ